LISVSNVSSLDNLGASFSFVYTKLINLIATKIENAINVKSRTDCKNIPHFTTACPMVMDLFEILIPPNINPMSGMIMPSTSEETILLNAAPITTATAKSMTLPLITNCLNSLKKLIKISPMLVMCLHEFLNIKLSKVCLQLGRVQPIKSMEIMQKLQREF